MKFKVLGRHPPKTFLVKNKMIDNSRINKEKMILGLVFFFIKIAISYSQTNEKAIKVTYEYYSCKPLQYDVELISNQKMSKFTNFRKREKFNMDWYQMEIEEKRETCFYDYKSKQYIENDIIKKKLIYANWEIDYQWNITNETKEILGYTVIKATRKIPSGSSDIVKYGDIYVWFCPDIPFFTGPKDNLGVPGLVLEAGYTKNPTDRYTAKKITFSDKALKITPKKEGIEVSAFYIENPLQISKSYLRKQAKKNN